MLKYANKLAVQELVKQASWWDSMKQSASDAWDGVKGTVRERFNAAGNLAATAGNKLKAGWHGMTGNVQGMQEAQRTADQKWNAMKEHAVNAGKHDLAATGHAAAFAAGFTPPGMLAHALRGAGMGGAKPAQSAVNQGITGNQAPKPAQSAAAPAAAPKPAQSAAAPAAAPKPAANTGGLTLSQMGGTGLGLPGNPSLTATQVNPNVGNPFAGSHTLGGMNPATISTIMNSPSAAPKPAQAQKGPRFDDKVYYSKGQMGRWGKAQGASDVNDRYHQFATWMGSMGRGKEATRDMYNRVQANGGYIPTR
jgi:hypothetical protein